MPERPTARRVRWPALRGSRTSSSLDERHSSPRARSSCVGRSLASIELEARAANTLTAMDLRCGCGQRLDSSVHNTPDPSDRPDCPSCGATSGWQASIVVTDRVRVRDGVAFKLRHAGRTGKPAVESFDLPAVQRQPGKSLVTGGRSTARAIATSRRWQPRSRATFYIATSTLWPYTNAGMMTVAMTQAHRHRSRVLKLCLRTRSSSRHRSSGTSANAAARGYLTARSQSGLGMRVKPSTVGTVRTVVPSGHASAWTETVRPYCSLRDVQSSSGDRPSRRPRSNVFVRAFSRCRLALRSCPLM